MKRTTLFLSVCLLAGCAGDGLGFLGGNRAAQPDATITPNVADPNAQPAGEETASAVTPTETTTLPPLAAAPATTETAVADPPPAPPPTARTAEEFDTTSVEDRNEAVAPAPPAADAAGDGRLGTTVASIGAADEPGFWIKTPLVTSPAAGRLFYPASGRTVQVQLIPSGGGTGSGSQVSLAALRLLDAPLDGLPELVVYRN